MLSGQRTVIRIYFDKNNQIGIEKLMQGVGYNDRLRVLAHIDIAHKMVLDTLGGAQDISQEEADEIRNYLHEDLDEGQHRDDDTEPPLPKYLPQHPDDL